MRSSDWSPASIARHLRSRLLSPAHRAEESPTPQFVPIGHFYSPFPDLGYVRANEARIYAPPPHSLPALDLREEQQLSLLSQCVDFYQEQPWQPNKTDSLHYFFENDFYSYTDALFLYFLLRMFKPRHYFEIGSGYSSCLALDVNERFLDGQLEMTFVEPYPAVLLSLLSEADLHKTKLLQNRLQDVDSSQFDDLDSGDVLFVDSTHVSKVDSDVHRIIFEILPRLKPGVLVHFHDIFYPFEYPKEWVYEGRAWQESYVLRAFLEYNTAFEIVLFNTFLATFHRDWLALNMPLCLRNTGGSLWLRKH